MNVESRINCIQQRSSLLAFVLTWFLPLILVFFNIACTARQTIYETVRNINNVLCIDLDCIAIVLGWLLLQIFLFVLPIGSGYCVRSGAMPYRQNGVLSFFISLIGIYALNLFGIFHPSYVYDNITKILIASIIVSFFISLLLFIKGNQHRRALKINPVIAFFYGSEINPILFGIDVRLFFELRPGLIGWAILNLCFFLKTLELYTHRIPPFSVLIATQQLIQSFQLLWYEEDRVSNEIIKNESFGFSQVFGSLCWLPFLWCLPSQYMTLINYPIKRIYIILSVILAISGIIIYRGAKNQCETFKKSRKNMEYILLNDGQVWLTSDWWSICRHPCYLGNLLMFISWSLPCGFTLIPWILPVYYLMVIYNRSRIEDAQCRKKYGALWDNYSKQVKYAVIPRLF